MSNRPKKLAVKTSSDAAESIFANEQNVSRWKERSLSHRQNSGEIRTPWCFLGYKVDDEEGRIEMKVCHGRYLSPSRYERVTITHVDLCHDFKPVAEMKVPKDFSTEKTWSNYLAA